MNSSITSPELEAAIQANPRDWDLRLVYADWLEEHGNEFLAKIQRNIGITQNFERISFPQTKRPVELVHVEFEDGQTILLYPWACVWVCDEAFDDDGFLCVCGERNGRADEVAKAPRYIVRKDGFDNFYRDDSTPNSRIKYVKMVRG